MIGGMKYSGENFYSNFQAFAVKVKLQFGLFLALSHINGFNFDSADFV
jgi:hypothetical protein